MIGGVYDAEMVAVDMLTDHDLENLSSKSVLRNTQQLFEDPEFDASVRISTNTSARVRVRIQAVFDMLGS